MIEIDKMNSIDRESPASWEDLLLLPTLADDGKVYMKRYPYQTELYEQYKELVPKELRISWLQAKLDENPIYLEPNQFPYGLLLARLPEVEHFVLWCRHKVGSDEIELYLESKLKDYTFVWYRNTLDKQSIPELFHVQVFVNFITIENKIEYLKNERYYSSY